MNKVGKQVIDIEKIIWVNKYNEIMALEQLGFSAPVAFKIAGEDSNMYQTTSKSFKKSNKNN